MTSSKKEWIGLGIMSGTSMDGIDFALCKFNITASQNYTFKILHAETLSYDPEILSKIIQAPEMNALEFIKFHKEYGSYTGLLAKRFLAGKEKPDFIASHGHTVFHEPNKRLTFQLGDGAFIAAETGISTISDFRNLDTAIGGQGAPLVPIGDKLLFSDFDYCLNLGGFANISFESKEKKRIAYDLCPVNIITNPLSQKLGYKFDNKGEIGKKGEVNNSLLKELNEISYYEMQPPKSLGREFVENTVNPILNKYDCSVPNLLRTLYEHFAIQITRSIKGTSQNKMLITGGGAHNTFLIHRIRESTSVSIVVPNKEEVEFKEALIFAFLGLRRLEKKENCLSTVTGALSDNCGGSVYYV